MIQFLTECSMCKSNAVFSVIYVVKQILQIVFVLVPIILIVLVTIDLAKNVVAGKEDDMKKNKNLAIKRIIYAVVIFFVPTIVNVVMNTIYRNTDRKSEAEYSKCWVYATKENVSACNKEAQAKQEEIDKARSKKSKEAMEEYKKKAEEQEQGREKQLGEKEESDPGNQPDSNPTPQEPGLSDEEKEKVNIIWIGDSRTNGMCTVAGLSSKETCIAKDGAGIAWLKSKDTKNKIYAALDKNSSAYVIINLGVNGISGLSKTSIETNVTVFVDVYKEIANKYPNAHIIVTSVGPVDEAKEASYEGGIYKVKNTNVNDFNTALESQLSKTNIKYCNINNTIRNGYVLSKDGIHYTNDTYKTIYSTSKSCF